MQTKVEMETKVNRVKTGSVGLLGRVLVAMIFLVAGLGKIPNFEQTVQYMTAQGFPLAPVFLFPAIFVEVIGGLMILVGLRARLASGLLFLYLIPLTVVFHGFWSLSGVERQMQFGNFLKNLAIMGGLLGIVAYGAGAISIDRWLERRRAKARIKAEKVEIKKEELVKKTA
jgi:putative oxidoreductase